LTRSIHDCVGQEAERARHRESGLVGRAQALAGRAEQLVRRLARIEEERAVDEHEPLDAIGMRRRELRRDERADRFAEGDEPADPERGHHLHDAPRVVADRRLLGDVVGPAVARVVDRDRAHARRERLDHLEVERRGLLVDVQQDDGRPAARLAAADLAERGRDQRALDRRRHGFRSASNTRRRPGWRCR
jgi:hypothetical protein